MLGSNATESDELRQLASGIHKGVSSAAEVVLEDTAQDKHVGVIHDVEAGDYTRVSRH